MGKNTFTHKQKNTFAPLFVICMMIVVLLFIAASDGTHTLEIIRY